jgi:hypothetical protein
MQTNNLPIPPSSVIEYLNDWVPALLFSSIALGFIAMATIQLIKPFFRSRFHRLELERGPLKYMNRIATYHEHEMDETIKSILSNYSLLELPIEQLTAQLQRKFEWEIARTYPSSNFTEKNNDAEMMYRNERVYDLQQALDSFQIKARSNWRRRLHLLSFCICLYLTSVLVFLFKPAEINIIGTVFFVVLVAFIGSFFASVARDMVAIIERLRN